MTDEMKRPPTELIAAVDVGTNSFHMVIASVSTRGVLRVHARDKEMVRLGAAAGDMKVIAADAIERGVETMRRFAHTASQHGAHVRAVATSAVREALNREDFVGRVNAATGVHIEVISGIEEGRLIYQGALHALPILHTRTLVFDIGGGSTETAIGIHGEPVFVHSAKIGHIRMTKRFFPTATITAEQVEECRRAIRGDWAPAFQSIIERGFELAVGCSGTLMAVAAIILAKAGKRIPESMNGMRLTRSEILEAVQTITQARTVEQRLAIPGMDAKRADVIVGGALILEQIILGLNIHELTVSAYALREGIVYDTVQKQRDIDAHHHLSHLRYQSVDHLCDLYHVRRPHAEHVKQLCLQLFDDLHKLHRYGDRERELLEAAALLHDVGYHISGEEHHKHSEYIIRNSTMPGFTNDEAELIASIVRYHRKSHPKKKHIEFGRMSGQEQQMVCALAGILRIAEGLDRRHQQLVPSVRAVVSDRSIDIYLTAPSVHPDIELWGAERRKELMEQTFGRGVRLLLHVAHTDDAK